MEFEVASKDVSGTAPWASAFQSPTHHLHRRGRGFTHIEGGYAASLDRPNLVSVKPEDIAALRVEYETAGLRRADLDANPFAQFDGWFSDAVAAEVTQANAFVLATADAEGRPSARALLMKDMTADGLVFFTNRASRKGDQMSANPHAAACFVWLDIHRQVRVEGSVELLSDATSDAYFESRPPGSRLAAAASAQSQVVADRAALEDARSELARRFPDGDVPRPPTWGGYLLRPDMFEFWQGRQDRFHDRFRYSMESGIWQVSRLAP